MTQAVSRARMRPNDRAAQILKALNRHPRTVKELSRAVGLTETAVGRYIEPLHTSGQIYVLNWIMVRGDKTRRLVAQWSAGSAPDELKPPPIHHHADDQDIDGPDQAQRLKAKRRESVRHAEAMVRELRKLPATTPLEAMVSAALYAGTRQ